MIPPLRNSRTERAPALPARQLGELDKVATSVVHLRDGRAGHLGRRHGESGTTRLDALMTNFCTT